MTQGTTPPRLSTPPPARPCCIAARAKFSYTVLMPTVMRVGPYRLFFYSADGGEPPHIHVDRDNHIAKLWLDASGSQRWLQAAGAPRYPADRERQRRRSARGME